jgi:hypothetical protein
MPIFPVGKYQTPGSDVTRTARIIQRKNNEDHGKVTAGQTAVREAPASAARSSSMRRLTIHVPCTLKPVTCPAARTRPLATASTACACAPVKTPDVSHWNQTID